MRIMTSNIWGDYFGNKVEPRKDTFIEFFLKSAPDILGIQEYTPGWYDTDMLVKLSDIYTTIGESGTNNNFVPLLIKTDKFNIVESGYEAYANTPDVSKGITYAVLSEKGSGKKLFVCNTHFWWMTGEEHDKLRCQNARQLIALMKKLCEKHSVFGFAFGDLNTKIESDAMQSLINGGLSLLIEKAEKADRVSSHHGDPEKVGEDKYVGRRTDNDYTHSIDHILSYAFEDKVKEYRIVEEQALLDVTDHSPVFAEIEF